MPIRRMKGYWVIEVGWPKMTAATAIKTVGVLMLILGFISLLASVLYDSYISAFVGLGLAFWGGLLLLIMPAKYVKLDVLTAASASLAASFEEMLSTASINTKGVYLPPKLLRAYESSLIFIPATDGEALPTREDVPEEKTPKTSKGLFLTPPGLALSKLFEKQMGKTFTELSLQKLTTELPKILEELEITKTAVVNIEGSNITVETRNNVFKDLCMETKKLEKTHEAVGCPFSSAVACALAKATGKPVTIEKEELSPDETTTTIQYRVLEG